MQLDLKHYLILQGICKRTIKTLNKCRLLSCLKHADLVVQVYVRLSRCYQCGCLIKALPYLCVTAYIHVISTGHFAFKHPKRAKVIGHGMIGHISSDLHL